MDFNVISQNKEKRFWWIDVIFYFAISLLIASVFSYVIFLIKNNIQREDIKIEESLMLQVGTEDQRKQEREVINYQNKINDFTKIIKNHEFVSNVFAFMQTETMPNIWFKQFTFNLKSAEIQLSGESDGLDELSRQVARLENNKYVKNLAGLNSSLSGSERINFSFSLSLDQEVLSYISSLASALQEPLLQEEILEENQDTGQITQIGDDQKLITSFHILLDPEVIGTINQSSLIINANVPYGTDISNLVAELVLSPGAIVIPASNTAQNFTNPVIYRVIAVDGSSQDYEARVHILPKEGFKINNSSGASTIITIILIIGVFIVIGIIVFFIQKRRKNKKVNNNLI